MAIKPTAQEIRDEGQLRDSYFPNCANTNAVNTFIESRIDDVDADVQLRAGDYYNSTDERVQKLLHKAEIYATLARIWQIIKNVMDGYDAEELPPEYVDPDQAAANRDYYTEEADSILVRFDGDSVTKPNQYVGGFIASSGTDYEGNLGCGY